MSYTLNFESHCSTLISALNKFREAKKFHDVCFLADSEKMYINRTVLAAYSPYMEQVLNDLNNTTVVFVAHGISAKTMNQLIDFMYRGVISIAPEDIMPLINAAKIYQIVGLKDCTNSEGSIGKTTPQGLQFSCTTPLHPHHLHTQTYIDPSLQKVPPSSFTANQHFRCPPQTISAQPLEQSAASACPPHKCCPHICASSHVTITSTSAAPSNASLARNVLLASGITITPTAVEPASSPSALCECSPNSRFHHQHIESPVNLPLIPVSDNSRQNYGAAESSSMLEPVTVPNSSLPTDHLPSQKAPVERSAAQVTTTCSPTPATNSQTITSSSSQFFFNRPQSEVSESCALRIRERSRSPLEIPKCHASPPARNDNSVAPNTHCPEFLSALKALADDLQNISSSSSEGDDDIINKVLAYSDTVLPANSTPHTGSTSPRGTVSRGPVTRRGHSFRSAGEQKNVSPLRESSEASNNESPAEAASSKSKGRVRGHYHGVGRPRCRRHGRPC